MDNFQNDALEYVVDDYYDDSDFENSFGEPEPQRNNGDFESLDSDFEDDFETSKSKTDTSALEARNGKDIQGIPWERLNFTRDKYREMRLRQYKNYENLSLSREEIEKDCLQVEKGKTFYDFQFNTRLVKSTIVHFQVEILHLALCASNIDGSLKVWSLQPLNVILLGFYRFSSCSLIIWDVNNLPTATLGFENCFRF
ncbi:hypothetical protein SLEP1_g20830 [Rubroshorea leprosula]|uniref:Uncharacterized protein n=1 Tax=Rubroshorea leprosula TaxID=152421 RepID=A0AAV5JEI0_9ROSI|nr:hypothetical protein SLEP1_g20830 [Rubroshorea leprosula]